MTVFRIVAALAIAPLATAHVQAAPANWKRYADAKLGLTVAYPPDWTLAKNFYDGVPEQHAPHGVSFEIPRSISEGTNLESAFLAVESIPGKICTPDKFDADAKGVATLKADGRSYTRSRDRNDVGFGEFYDTQIFVVDGLPRCLAVHYFIHVASMTHFAPGEAKPFDPETLWKTFDEIRATMSFRK